MCAGMDYYCNDTHTERNVGMRIYDGNMHNVHPKKLLCEYLSVSANLVGVHLANSSAV